MHPSNESIKQLRSTRWQIAALITAAVCIAAVVGWQFSSKVVVSSDIVSLQVAQATNVSASQLQVGHCLRTLPDYPRVNTVVVVPCETSHKAQVIHIDSIESDQAERPSLDALRSQFDAVCQQVPLKKVTEDSSYTLWVPSQESWRDGDRPVMCLLVAANITESLLESQ